MILHIDLDAFFASVEQRDDPRLRGRPVLVGAPTGRSVVAAASYEARVFGCKSAMPMTEARRRCPQAIVVTPRMPAYAAASRRFRAILDRYSPLVEPLSLDEAFVDVSASERLFGAARDIAARIRREVQAELELTCSVGIAPVKFAAKIASDLCKPDGMREVSAAELPAFLAPLPIERLFGVGPKMAERLRRLGIATLAEIAGYPEDALVARLGGEAQRLRALALGIDPREVQPDREARSIGAEDTFPRDLPDGDELRLAVTAQAERVAERLRREGLVAQVLVLKLKDPQFKTSTRRRSLASPSSDGRVFVEVALELLRAARLGPDRVRLAGVAAHGLSSASAPRQLSLDPQPERGDRLMGALDAIRDKFGRGAISRAELMDTEAREQRRAQRSGESLANQVREEDE